MAIQKFTYVHKVEEWPVKCPDRELPTFILVALLFSLARHRFICTSAVFVYTLDNKITYLISWFPLLNTFNYIFMQLRK